MSNTMSLTRVVAITGCDSGLGWAIAARIAREGLVTVAGMYHGTDTQAAQDLKKMAAHPCSLDVTDKNSISAFKEYIDNLLKENPNYTLYAVVNNSGIMTVGDFEWQTESMVENTIKTNLLGTIRVTSAFLPDLRRVAMKGVVKPRIINIASHCGMQPLPGFAVYSASKAGVLAWTSALRMENRRFGLPVTAFVPGGFVGSSNIISSQAAHGKAMLENLDNEQKSCHEKRLTALNNYLGAASQNTSYNAMKDERIIETFMKSLTDVNPNEMYKVEPWRYKLYYSILLKLPLPESVRCWLIKKFLSFPDE